MATQPSSAVAEAIYTQMDRISKWYAECRTALSADNGDDFWTLVDAVDDETYENYALGATMTTLDGVFGTPQVGSIFRGWIQAHANYARALGYSSLDAMITAMGFRVNSIFNAVYYGTLGSYLTARNVFPETDVWATITGAAGPGVTITNWAALTSLVGTTESPTPLKVLVDTNPGSGKVLSVTVKAYRTSTDATGQTFTVSVSDAGVVTLNEGAAGVLGGTTISSDPALGATTVVVADGGGISNVANSYILISETISSIPCYQYAKMASISTNTITLATGEGLKYDFSTSAVVKPCFYKIDSPAENEGTHDAVDGVITIGPVADREPAW